MSLKKELQDYLTSRVSVVSKKMEESEKVKDELSLKENSVRLNELNNLAAQFGLKLKTKR